MQHLRNGARHVAAIDNVLLDMTAYTGPSQQLQVSLTGTDNDIETCSCA